RADGRIVELKAHRARWSGRYPDNSLDGLRECFAEGVARAEIDFRMWNGEFVVTHDDPGRGTSPTLLGDALAIVHDAAPGPTVLMLDAQDLVPWARRGPPAARARHPRATRQPHALRADAG